MIGDYISSTGRLPTRHNPKLTTEKMRLLFSIFAFVVAKQWDNNDITVDEVERRPLSAAFEINLDKIDVWIEGTISARFQT